MEGRLRRGRSSISGPSHPITAVGCLQCSVFLPGRRSPADVTDVDVTDVLQHRGPGGELPVDVSEGPQEAPRVPDVVSGLQTCLSARKCKNNVSTLTGHRQLRMLLTTAVVHPPPHP